ncbi:MAG: two-component system response regulator (stage 0 sporulation protein F) [Marivirga sp.]|jgi:two-component system response regulator (stage 0 sporulation protein F)
MAIKKNASVLYLDDEDINLFIFEANFKNKFNVITANSPTLALELLESHKEEISAVISDMRMPLMNGIEFIQKAKSIHKNIPFYILTGFDHNTEIKDAVDNKIVSKYFIKPFDVNEIETEINSVINNL